MAILNYTTSISVDRTVGKIQAMLARHGANAIGVRYVSREPVGVNFAVDLPGGEQSFALPVDVDAMVRLLAQQHADRRIDTKHVRRDVLLSREHAARVAWCIVKDWLEAQLAIIETRMVSFDQVMLPYMVVGPRGTTVYDEYRQRQLEAST